MLYYDSMKYDSRLFISLNLFLQNNYSLIKQKQYNIKINIITNSKFKIILEILNTIYKNKQFNDYVKAAREKKI